MSQSVPFHVWIILKVKVKGTEKADEVRYDGVVFAQDEIEARVSIGRLVRPEQGVFDLRPIDVLANVRNLPLSIHRFLGLRGFNGVAMVIQPEASQ